MTKDNYKVILQVLIPVLAALLSFFLVTKVVTSTQYTKKTIDSLDDKKTTVMELTAASTAASAAVSLLPGDAGSSIADKLADLSSYFLIVLCAIYLEKFLVTITGVAAFKILIPAACTIIAANVFMKNKTFTQIAVKMILFGFAIAFVIPVSVRVSDYIETTYEESIDATISDAKATTEEIQESSNTDESSSEEGILTGIVSKVKDGVSDATTKVENTLNHFIEALAVLLVTSCLIPIIVLLFFAWLIKMLLGVNFDMKKPLVITK